MGLLETIKKAGIDAVDASNPVKIMYGEVLRTNPLEVRVDQRFTLTADFLVLAENMTRLEIDLRHNHSYSDRTTGDALNNPIIIRTGLLAGDKVILLRMQGGQKYVILDKVVSA